MGPGKCGPDLWGLSCSHLWPQQVPCGGSGSVECHPLGAVLLLLFIYRRSKMRRRGERCVGCQQQAGTRWKADYYYLFFLVGFWHCAGVQWRGGADRGPAGPDHLWDRHGRHVASDAKWHSWSLFSSTFAASLLSNIFHSRTSVSSHITNPEKSTKTKVKSHMNPPWWAVRTSHCHNLIHHTYTTWHIKIKQHACSKMFGRTEKAEQPESRDLWSLFWCFWISDSPKVQHELQNDKYEAQLSLCYLSC